MDNRPSCRRLLRDPIAAAAGVLPAHALDHLNLGEAFKFSNSPCTKLLRCKALASGRGAGKAPVGCHIVGGGIEISRRPWVDDVSAPIHAHLVDVLIDRCLGVGLTSTSAPPGSRTIGSVLVIRGGCSAAINLTQLPGIRLKVQEIICEDGWQPLYEDVAAPIAPQNDADVQVFGRPVMAVERLTKCARAGAAWSAGGARSS